MADHRAEPTVAPECIAAITAALFLAAAASSALLGLCGVWGAGLYVAALLVCPGLYLCGVALGPGSRPHDEQINWD